MTAAEKKGDSDSIFGMREKTFSLKNWAEEEKGEKDCEAEGERDEMGCDCAR